MVISKLKAKQEHLLKEIEELRVGLNTPGFSEKVGVYQFELMTNELKVMSEYKTILDQRIIDLRLKNLIK